MFHEMTVINRNGESRTVASGELPREFPVKLIVNGSELTTLIASPHDLRFLVAGFLRLQGYVRTAADIDILSICEDSGIANIRIKGILPRRSAPILTSGCGGGVSFHLPSSVSNVMIEDSPNQGRKFNSEAIFRMFDLLLRHADRYRRHGGIHSAAVSDGEAILLYAEDLGRHNTIDRLAGEALLRGIDLCGMALITSGRISSEMAGKAAQLGISLVASRTSPTDMAAKICNDAGITLIGYARANRFAIYSHPGRIDHSQVTRKIDDVTGVVLAGGRSTRMGRDKAMLDVRGMPFIQLVYQTLSEIFPEVVVVTNEPERYEFLDCRMVSDLYPGKGTLAGIHAGLAACGTGRAFVVGCDMPFLNTRLIRRLVESDEDVDALVPRTPDGQQPLHAVYNVSCLPVMERHLWEGDISVLAVLDDLRVRIVLPEEIARFDSNFKSFININTPLEYDQMVSAGG